MSDWVCHHQFALEKNVLIFQKILKFKHFWIIRGGGVRPYLFCFFTKFLCIFVTPPIIPPLCPFLHGCVLKEWGGIWLVNLIQLFCILVSYQYHVDILTLLVYVIKWFDIRGKSFISRSFSKYDYEWKYKNQYG